MPDQIPEQPINLKHLSSISDADREFERDLLEVYLEDSYSHLELARQAIAAKESNGLGREAHHLKGASGNVGADTMQALSKELELAGKTGNWAAALELIPQLEQGLSEVAKFLASHYSG
ncbi:MAG: Hpt domain-containing protein [Pseudanabaenaceae cyanobacterium bins.68]|nr:Hpt domain-containing protein [Pseudanabaenaceae cyanobacterium bins.68]